MSNTQRARVLVVEDDAEYQDALADFFASAGYEVQVAGNGADAILHLDDDGARPCAVLVDLLMPGIVGQELLEYLQTSEELRAIPVAIVSGSPQLAPQGYRVFQNPVALDQLLAFVRDSSARATCTATAA